MQSALDVGNNNDTTLVTAQALKEMTVTKDELFARQKASVLDSLMSSMVRIATEVGGNDYIATLNPQFDQNLLNEIVDELTTLGYIATVQDKVDTVGGQTKVLTIIW